METKPARRRRTDRKAQLAAVAADLFCERGYHGVGITDIAAAAGVTGPALYRHFSDKQAILAHVVLSGIDELVATTKLALDGSETPAPDQVEATLTELAKLAVERRDVAALWRWERRNLDEQWQREIARRSADMIGRWAESLRKMRPELGSADAELLCWAALSVFGSVAVHSTRIGKRRYADLLVDRARVVLHSRLPEADTREHEWPEVSVLQPSRREMLIVEAANLFQERGFHDVSMEDIGSAVGIAGPSVYRHFPSKAALFVAGASRIAERLELGRVRVAQHAATEADALRGLVGSYVETMRTSADLMSVGRQISALPEADRAELRRVQRDYVAEWVRLLTTVRPEMTTPEARVVVHMALTIANDLLRTGRVRNRPAIDAELEALMVSVLGLEGYSQVDPARVGRRSARVIDGRHSGRRDDGIGE